MQTSFSDLPIEQKQIESSKIHANDQNYHQTLSIHSLAMQKFNELNSLKQDDILKFFENYQLSTKSFTMQQLIRSNKLTLKKYKQSIYYGQTLNNKRYGKGIMIYKNGRFYQGQWENQYKHGLGYQKFSNQSEYSGEYINGKPHGIGRYSWPNGQYYQGEWENGNKHGSGTWKGVKGDSYIGEWKFGKSHGNGVHIWINGDIYQGQFSQGVKHGYGIQKFASGDTYKGNFLRGKAHGYGQYYWANKSYFKGEFNNGFRNGNGLWKKHQGNSDKYQGQYSMDKKHGYGVFTWISGNTYKGNYTNDARNGYGEMYWTDGSYYKGDWKDGVQHGSGQLYTPQDSYKYGIFQNNKLIMIESQQPPNYQNKKTIHMSYISLDNSQELKGKNTIKSRYSIPSNMQTVIYKTEGLQNKRYSIRPMRNNLNEYGKTFSTLQKTTQKQKSIIKRDKLIKFNPKNKNRILHSSLFIHDHSNNIHQQTNAKNLAKKWNNSLVHTEATKRQNIYREIKLFTKGKFNLGI